MKKKHGEMTEADKKYFREGYKKMKKIKEKKRQDEIRKKWLN